MDTYLKPSTRCHANGLLYLLEIQTEGFGKCRIYLQVLSFADRTSANGRYIIPHYKQGILSQDRKSTYNWSTQQRSGKQAWILWKMAVQHLKSRNGLRHPLGGPSSNLALVHGSIELMSLLSEELGSMVQQQTISINDKAQHM
jgi:hypothetical protein